VSGSGQQAIDELRDQVGELLNGRPAQSTVYPHQIAFNCLPQIGAFCADGATEEEQRLAEETRRLLGDRSLRISATAVRVPVFYGDSFSLNVETREKISATRAGELLVATPGVEVVDDPAAEIYPHPVDAAGQEAILVGRLREDASIEHGLSFWIVADSLRRGAATNAVQIAEYLAAHYL
jgi:aspartate-semialdehyde dehydrogenase